MHRHSTISLISAAPFVLAAALAAAPAMAAAQVSAPAAPVTPVAIENTNSTLVPTTSDIPQASPARPTVTSPAHIPPSGYLQFEQGFARADASPAGVSAQSAINQTTKIALTTRLMVQLISQPYTLNVVDNPAPGASSPATRSSDAGDLDLGAQFIVRQAAGPTPTIAAGYIRRLRAGTASNLDIGDLTQSALLLFSGDFRGGFHYDSNLIFNQQDSAQNSSMPTAHSISRAQLGQSFALSHPLFARSTGGRLTGSAELSHFTQPFVATTSAGVPLTRANTLGLLFAGGYALRPNIVLDAAFYRGLTSTSTQWEGTAGITYLLPHRLWPDRHPVPLKTRPYR
jgi:hypothetical protein